MNVSVVKINEINKKKSLLQIVLFPHSKIYIQAFTGEQTRESKTKHEISDNSLIFLLYLSFLWLPQYLSHFLQNHFHRMTSSYDRYNILHEEKL
jgi:hypothetical protein